MTPRKPRAPGRPRKPRGTTKVAVHVSLSRECLERLDAIAETYDTTRTGAIEIAVEWCAETRPGGLPR